MIAIRFESDTERASRKSESGHPRRVDGTLIVGQAPLESPIRQKHERTSALY
jgi:hypothetical protein